MDNDSLDILFFNKKKEVHFFSARAFSKNIHFFVRRISDGYKSFIIIKIDMMMMLYDMKLKRKKWQDNLYISTDKIKIWKTRQRFFTMTL